MATHVLEGDGLLLGKQEKGLVTRGFEKVMNLLKKRKEAAEEVSLPRITYAQTLIYEETKRKRTICTPYEGIKSVLNEKPRVIFLHEILKAYIANSLNHGKDDERVQAGMVRITRAYNFGQCTYEEDNGFNASKVFRKDGFTPAYSHPTRLAMMAAYLGAGSDLISGLLIHDHIEDCGNTLKQVMENIGKRASGFVALLTEPKLVEHKGKLAWVYLAKNPKEWERASNRIGDEKYEEQFRCKFDGILNINAPGISAEMKVKAFIGKILDALDNLVTDQHISRVNAGIRLGVLASEIRHLEVLGPGLRDIILDILEERGYTIPRERSGRWKPKPNEKVIILPLPENNLNVAYLDRMPAPNGFITLYSLDESISEKLKCGKFEDALRVELPNSAPKESVRIMKSFFSSKGLQLECTKGESLLPLGSDAAGRIVMVNGVKSLEMYNRFIRLLEEFHGVLENLTNGTGPTP